MLQLRRKSLLYLLLPLPVITIAFVWIYARVNWYGARTREEIVINYLEALKQKDEGKIERLLSPESTPDREEIKQKIDRLGGYQVYEIAEIYYFQDKPFITRVTIKGRLYDPSLKPRQFEENLLMGRQAATTFFGFAYPFNTDRWYLDLVKKQNSSTNIPAAEVTPPAGVLKK
jgi:hypothetical protein